jgi:hypothetical protein
MADTGDIEQSKPARCVTGYSCPKCQFSATGIEVEGDSGSAGWRLNVPLEEISQIRCARCGSAVPRTHWWIEGDD